MKNPYIIAHAVRLVLQRRRQLTPSQHIHIYKIHRGGGSDGEGKRRGGFRHRKNWGPSHSMGFRRIMRRFAKLWQDLGYLLIGLRTIYCQLPVAIYWLSLPVWLASRFTISYFIACVLVLHRMCTSPINTPSNMTTNHQNVI